MSFCHLNVDSSDYFKMILDFLHKMGVDRFLKCFGHFQY